MALFDDAMINVSYLTKNYGKKIEYIKKLDADVNFLFITDCHSGLISLRYKSI